jgi:hypothetical protein
MICLLCRAQNEVNFKDILEIQNINLTKSIITTLTSPEFEGRDIERESISRSMAYIESLLRAYNIKPCFESYRIPYKIDNKRIGYNIVALYNGGPANNSHDLVATSMTIADKYGIIKS